MLCHVSLPVSWTGALANTHDDVRSEPGSWIVIGMIPTFKKKIAQRAGRPKNGPNGCPRRKIHLLHQCYGALLSGWNAITANVKILQWADGIFRRSRIFLAGLLADLQDLQVPEGEAELTCPISPQECF